jgi:hypothetical protein
MLKYRHHHQPMRTHLHQFSRRNIHRLTDPPLVREVHSAMALWKITLQAPLLTHHHQSSLRESRKHSPGRLSGQAAMMAPQTSTRRSAQVPTLVSHSHLCLSGILQALVRSMTMYLSTQPYVRDRRCYPTRMPSLLLRGTRPFPSHQPLRDRLHLLDRHSITLSHSRRRCHQKSLIKCHKQRCLTVVVIRRGSRGQGFRCNRWRLCPWAKAWPPKPIRNTIAIVSILRL